MLTTTPGPAFVFPGQGSQHPGMARDLTVCGAAPRDLVGQAEQVSGLDLTGLMSTADAAALADPEVAQLLVFVSSSVLLAELAERGARPAIVAGHSLGEFTALVACGSLEWRAALELVAHRGKAMAAAARARPGAMGAVVGLTQAQVRQLCDETGAAGGTLVLANINSARQTVVSGSPELVDAALDAARAAGAIRARRIPVGGAYHSPLMAPARDSLAPLLRQAPLSPPRAPFVSSVTGDLVTDIDAYREQLLDQVTQPVRWHDGVRSLAAAGAGEFVEVGPGRVLTGLGRETARGARHLSALEALRGRSGTAALTRRRERA